MKNFNHRQFAGEYIYANVMSSLVSREDIDIIVVPRERTAFL